MIYSVKALEDMRRVLLLYLRSKVDSEDWHGTADAAMDLREIDAMLAVHTGLHKGKSHV